MSVNELQRSTVDRGDYDIAFTKEYFDKVRSEAETLGDVLLRTMIVASHQDWSIQRENAVIHLGNVRKKYLLFLIILNLRE